MKLWMAPVLAAIISLAVTWALGFIVIPFLHKLKFGQTILDIGPSWHKKKQGTPTMGGIMFIAGFVVSMAAVLGIFAALGLDVVAWGAEIGRDSFYIRLFAGILMSVGFAFIGFVDDYIKVVKKRNLGLTEKQKTIGQLAVIVVFLATLTWKNCSATFIPYYGKTGTGVFANIVFWLLGIVAIYATVNAANFTDGVDGLCSSVSAIQCIGFGVCAVILGFKGLTLPCAALCGALIGFFIWNRNPAKVMMGDVGSLFIGGMMCTFAYCLNAPWLILLVCFIYVLEFVTDLIQIAYSVTHRGAKLFKMAPIHHHYEQSGWSEKRICAVFCAITVICNLAAVALSHFGNVQ